MVAVLQARPDPQAPRETAVAVRNLASVEAEIALALLESSVQHGHEESDLNLRSQS